MINKGSAAQPGEGDIGDEDRNREYEEISNGPP